MDRRREPMLWKIVERSTNLVFLLLAIVILSKQMGDEKTTSQIVAEKKVLMDIIDNRTLYLEDKVNRVSETSDSYNLSASSRLGILEDRVKVIEQENKALKHQQKIINNNLNYNNNIVNAEKR